MSYEMRINEYYYYFSLYVDEISVNRNVITTLVKFDKYSLNMKTE